MKRRKQRMINESNETGGTMNDAPVFVEAIHKINRETNAKIAKSI